MITQIQNIKFKNKSLLKTALTHRSALNENRGAISYERLEYLGDAVLELIVSDFLYKKFPNKPEGELTHLRAKIVQTKTLAKASQGLKLGQNLILSTGEKRAGGQENVSILADLFESIVGAIYLDQGLDITTKFIQKNLLNNLNEILKDAQITDFKSKLQEAWQKKFKITPTYKLLKTLGPDHDKIFTVTVFVNQKKLGEGSGKSKQDAQQQAAKQALEKTVSI